MKTIRFGIVGCGMIARYHALAISDTAHAVFIGACSHSRASAEALCHDFSARVFSDYEEMLTCDEIDVVVICAPSGDHFGQAQAALLHGKHVVIEKPMCLSLAEADTLIALADKKGRMACVISQTRFSDAVQAIHATLASGFAGKCISAALTMRYERQQPYYDQAAWRGTRSGDGGGVLMNQGIHGIDVLCYLLGQPASVCGYADTLLRDIEVEDTAMAAVKFSSGALACIDATVCSKPSFSKKLNICTESGTIILEEDAITTWTLPIPCPLPMGCCSGSSAAADPRGITHCYHAREYENIIAHLTGGAPLLIDVRQGKIPLSVILGVYESSRSGKAVCLL